MASELQAFVKSIVLRNSLEGDLSVVLEPWAERHVLGRGRRARVTVKGAAPGELEIVVEDQLVTIYGFAGSIVDFERMGESTGPSA